MKKTLYSIAASFVALFAFSGVAFAAAPNWDVSGTHTITFDYLGSPYAHEMTLTEDSLGNLTGSGGYPSGGPLVYTWVVDSGSVSGDTFTLTAHYTATPDAVTPLTVMHVNGTIAGDGSISGTWDDNYQGGSRGGTFATAAGVATAVDPSPEVHIFKYIDSVQATAANANSAVFPMLTTFNSSVYGLNTDIPFTLSPVGWGASDSPYEASYVGGARGDDYATHEVTGTLVGASCADGKSFSLVGYSTGDTLLAAAGAATTTIAPAFTNLQTDKYVIVWNKKCITKPIIISPANNICVTSANQQLIDWTDSLGAPPITYQYQAYSDAAYSNLVYDSGMTLGASQIATPGTPDGTYYVRVRAQDSNGFVSDWSNGVANPFKIVVSSVFTMSAFLPPLNISGKTYNTGSTVPVKVQITNACGLGLSSGVPSISIAGPVPVSGTFKADGTSGQYSFNWGTTKGFAGSYTITAGAGTTGLAGPFPSTIVLLSK